MRLFCNMREIITSTKNATVKLARSLAEKKFREEHGLFLVEGGNIVKDIPAGTEVEFYLVSESRAEETAAALALTRAKVYYVTDAVMKSLSDTVTPYGLAAAVKIPERQFALPEGNAILLDGVSDPGNLGTVIRTAAAAGFGRLLLPGCDFLRRKLHRRRFDTFDHQFPAQTGSRGDFQFAGFLLIFRFSQFRQIRRCDHRGLLPEHRRTDPGRIRLNLFRDRNFVFLKLQSRAFFFCHEILFYPP